MVRNIFKEEFQAYQTSIGTTWGIISFIVGALIWGYLIINYTDTIESFILSKIQFIPPYLINPALWIIFSFAASTISIIISFILISIIQRTGIKNKNLVS